MSKSDRYIEAVGRRKTSVARVRLTPGGKKLFMVNDRALEQYFKTDEQQSVVRRPLTQAQAPEYAITAKIVGGGIHSQAEALSHGIARALVKADANLKTVLKPGGFLTRDSRMKERRKFGLKKARKAPQWSKR